MTSFVSLLCRRNFPLATTQYEHGIELTERLSLLCGVAVIVGLFIEVFVTIGFLEHGNAIQKLASIASSVFVAVGVAGEIYFANLSGKLEKELRHMLTIESTEKIANLERLAAEANKQAKEAEERSVQAQLELEKVKAPRVLTGEQIAAISDALRPLSGQTYDLSLPRMMEPGAAINTQLIAALRMAGWKLQSVQSHPRRMITFPEAIFAEETPVADGPINYPLPPIQIGVSDGWIGICAAFEQGDSISAHGAFLSALIGVGVQAHLASLSEMRPGVFPPKAGPTTVHIIIGSKS